MNAIEKSISKAEMARHCRRRTRGVEETAKGIEALLLQFTPATDTLGVPLFRYIYSCVYIYSLLYCTIALVNRLLTSGKWRASMSLAFKIWKDFPFTLSQDTS